MKTSNISKISASIPNTKKAKFNLSHDNNTTYDWGSVQPLMSKLMLPDSSININMEQLTRLAPMVVPTFGRVKLKNIAHFIPMQEIYPNWDAMMSQTKVTRSAQNTSGGPTTITYIPKNVPYIPNNILAMYCLAGTKVNLYYSGTVGTSDENRWICTNNSGTFASPSPNSAMTLAAREYLNKILSIDNTTTPSAQTINEFKYTGYVFNPRKIVLNKTSNTPLIDATGSNAGVLPTISTMACQALPNANKNGYTHSANNEDRPAGIGGANVNLGPISFDGADIIWEYAGAAGAGITSAERAANATSPLAGITASNFDGRKIRLVFKLSSFGKRLRKILIGLGYDVNLANDDNVSILPLIAFYKAWWDTYAPERVKNFYETAAWKVINACMSTATGTALVTRFNTAAGQTLLSNFKEFIANLGTCFATERIDAISAATDAYYTDSSNFTINTSAHNTTDFQQTIQSLLDETFGVNGEDGSSGLYQSETSNFNTNTNPKGQEVIYTNGNYSTIKITQTQLNALKKAYIVINKQSIAGKKVEEILRALGLGDYVEECKGKFINANDNAIKISDVVATAATSDAKLGQYGGRGIGVGNFQFSFQTNRHGYLIILSSIVPESGYINAPVRENEAINFETMYNPEFDGLAYEAIQKKNLAGSPLINDASYADTFGFLPTYTQWKFMTNKANGDFSLNSMKTSLTPYTLDKYIPVADTNVYDSHIISTGTNQGSTEIDCAPSFKYSDLPNAGEDYRFINKFPWNGNYNRIFAADDDGFEWSVFSKNNNQFLYNSFEYDNFLVHNVFDIAYWAHMKSIEDSYGTYDEEHGAPNSTVTRS